MLNLLYLSQMLVFAFGSSCHPPSEDDATYYVETSTKSDMNFVSFDNELKSKLSQAKFLSAGYFENLVYISGGSFNVGTSNENEGYIADGEYPLVSAYVAPYFMDKYEVSNFQFSEFVSSTNYTTDAERFGWSFVFHSSIIHDKVNEKIDQVASATPWWLVVPKAYWKYPEGYAYDNETNEVFPDKNVLNDGRGKYPASHISWNDARDYCSWRYSNASDILNQVTQNSVKFSGRLPLESEWEYAARGGVSCDEHNIGVVLNHRNCSVYSSKRYPWGDKIIHSKDSVDITDDLSVNISSFSNSFKHKDLYYRANIYQGSFPKMNSKHDGYELLAPVDMYGPQVIIPKVVIADDSEEVFKVVYSADNGLYNMIGNVWEWVEDDWNAERHLRTHSSSLRKQKTQKGGSFLCHSSYCNRYRIAARHAATSDSSSSNTGFRCVIGVNL